MEYSIVPTQFIHGNKGGKGLTNNRRMLTKQENIGGGEVIHDAVVMGKVCYVIGNDVGDDKVFWE